MHEEIDTPREAVREPIAAGSICGIIVSFFPSRDLLGVIDSVRSQIDELIVVDNASDGESVQILDAVESKGIRIFRNPENLGIATALNQGIQWVRQQGYDWVLTLDQDTICESDMVQIMRKAYEADPQKDKIAVLAPIHYDKNTNYLSAELRDLKDTVVERNYVMTSGNLIPLRMFDELGSYDDDLFIEYVDHDFCLRAKRKGYKIKLVRDARMAHHLGEMRPHSLGRLFTFFSHNYRPVRRYYRARNRLILYRRHFGKWIIQDQVFAIKDMIKILIVEQQRWAKVKATIVGTIDGLLSRVGSAEGATHSTPKAPRYFVEFREEILPLLPARSDRAMDLGCGSGATSGELRRMGRFGWVCGVEGNPEVAKIAAKELDQVLLGDIEKMEYPFPPNSIDTILTLDILEHLVDPWKVLKQLHGLLKPGGRLVVSIPNMRHYSVVIPLLLLGDIRYQQEGILDSTHLRFFTKKTVIRMLQQAGFEIELVDHTGAKRGLGALVNKLTFGLFKEFFIFQNLVACRKPLEIGKRAPGPESNGG